MVKSALRFLIAAVLTNLAFYAYSSECQLHHCLAVVDAGSTGSRLHVYAFDFDKSKMASNIKEIWSKKIKPGLATLDTNQPAIDSYLNNLFSGAPAEQLPVYFYATAGMRLLPQPKQKQFYELIGKWFASQLQWQMKSAKTITGDEEGLYGWLGVNYQLGTLSSPKNTVGVMDMGGASVQITFPVDKIEGLTPANLKQVNVHGQLLNVFTHSFLGLGQTETSHQFLDVPSCFADNYELPTSFPAAGDATQCEHEIASLINNVHHVDSEIQPALQANPITKWYVIGGVAELAKSKPFQFEGGQFTNQSLLEQADIKICRQQWSTLNVQFPGNDYLFGYCLFPAYYYALIVEGYGFSAQQPINYFPSNQLSDWTIGVVLTEKA